MTLIDLLENRIIFKLCHELGIRYFIRLQCLNSACREWGKANLAEMKALLTNYNNPVMNPSAILRLIDRYEHMSSADLFEACQRGSQTALIVHRSPHLFWQFPPAEQKAIQQQALTAPTLSAPPPAERRPRSCDIL